MAAAASFFAPTYAEARAGFLAAAEAAGLLLQSHLHPLLGRDGETLAMDVARAGPAEADAVLLISSACHGVEGFCGSGVQRALLADAAFQRQAADAGVALVYVHALNPWGFSWWRRTTHENVDLNRNFHDFHAPLPPNPGYDELAGALVPAQWPSPAAESRIAEFAARHGAAALQRAVTSGQHDHPEGIFYGGRAPTWSQQTLRHVLQDHGRRCQRMAWIDVHTGLGPSGHGERIFAGPDDAAAVARARAWWGEVTSIYDGTSTSAKLTGLMCLAAAQECPQAQHTGIALEYGTVPLPQVIEALRADQWLENHPEADDTRRQAIKRQTRDAFYTDTDDWKAQILRQGLQAARQGLAGLASSGGHGSPT
jgi:hypothetical protein